MKRVAITKAFLVIIIVFSIIVGGALAFVFINPNVLGLISSDGRITISKEDYNELVQLNERYRKAETIRDIVKKQYYVDVDDSDIDNMMIKGIVAGTGDIYSGYYTEEEYNDLIVSLNGEYDGIGVTMTASDNGYIEVLAVTKESPAQDAGVKIGDYILKVNGVEYTAENMDLAAAAIRGKKGTTVTITFITADGKQVDREITRAHIVTDTVDYKMLENNIAYIAISSFENATAKDFTNALNSVQNAQALIIDLRDNPGGLVDQAISIADDLMDNATVVYTEDHNHNKDYFKTSDGKKWSKPFVVLVNENSASASEILAAGLQDNAVAKIVGKTSYGKGIIQALEQFNDGSALKLTKWQYFTPSGKQIHKNGITPDYEVEGEDAQLQKAIELLTK